MSAHPVDRALAAMTELVERQHRLEDEVQMLRALNDQLAARNADLEDGEYVSDMRAAYRRGYLTGRNAARRGSPDDPCPEASARGPLGRLIRPAVTP